MTLSDIRNAAAQIEEKYFNLGGKKELFSEFITTLEQAIDFDLVAEWVETPVDLVGQFFTDRHRGIVRGKKLAEIVSEIAEKEGNGDKTYSFLDKRYL